MLDTTMAHLLPGQMPRNIAARCSPSHRQILFRVLSVAESREAIQEAI